MFVGPIEKFLYSSFLSQSKCNALMTDTQYLTSHVLHKTLVRQSITFIMKLKIYNLYNKKKINSCETNFNFISV